jgi:hypothetical protein
MIDTTAIDRAVAAEHRHTLRKNIPMDKAVPTPLKAVCRRVEGLSFRVIQYRLFLGSLFPNSRRFVPGIWEKEGAWPPPSRWSRRRSSQAEYAESGLEVIRTRP